MCVGVRACVQYLEIIYLYLSLYGYIFYIFMFYIYIYVYIIIYIYSNGSLSVSCVSKQILALDNLDLMDNVNFYISTCQFLLSSIVTHRPYHPYLD